MTSAAEVKWLAKRVDVAGRRQTITVMVLVTLTALTLWLSTHQPRPPVHGTPCPSFHVDNTTRQIVNPAVCQALKGATP